MQAPSASIESVLFSFLTDEETRRLSFKKITSPILLDNLTRPVEGGLYDLALGAVDDGQM